MIQQLANAIATQEGFFRPGGSLPATDKNPGDLRRAPWLQHAVVVDGFWKAPSLGMGIAGLLHQIALDVARGVSLKELIYSWAPPEDNNQTDVYLASVRRKLMEQGVEVDPEKPLANYSEVKMIP